MATSPIYSWPEPDNTDLVKNGALAIRTMGDAIDTTMGTMTPKSTFTAKGSIAAATAASTPANLSVGANNTTLVADSAQATGLKWALPAMTLVKRATFTSVATTTTTFDDVFSSTYKTYQIVIEGFGAATPADDLHLQYRAGGTTLSTSTYFGNNLSNVYTSIITTNTTSASQNFAILALNCSTPNQGYGSFSVTGVGYVAYPAVFGNFIDTSGATSAQTYQINITAGTQTGFLLKSSSSNISGTVAVYGLA